VPWAVLITLWTLRHSKASRTATTPLQLMGPLQSLEKRQKAVNQEYHDRTKKLDSELHGTQQDQRGPIESELNEYGSRVVSLPQLSAATGVLLQTSASYWTLLPGS